MRLKHVKGAEDAVLNSPHCISLTNELRHNLRSVFDNNNPLMLEIGCGKGQFIIELARHNPAINYIGIERYSSVLLRACQKMDAMETPLPNLKFLCYDAEVLPDFLNENDVAGIYLNFSDPWPKDRHAKRRLTSERFIERYEKFLCKDGFIQFKTDNQDLFEYSVISFTESGYKFIALTRDLHHDEVLNKDNIMTEYEEKFVKNNKKINLLKAVKE